ncbi:MAG: hypothetical protein U0354_11385 [Candidatus Sericytochromatia bacterium]
MSISNLNFNNGSNIQIESKRINNIKNQELNKNTSSKDITTNENIKTNNNKDISNIKDLKDSKEINTQIKFNKNDINKTLSPFQKEILINILSDKQKTEFLKNLPIDINKIPINNMLKIMSNFMNVDVFFKFAQQLNNEDLKKILEKLPNDILTTLHKNTNKNDSDINREEKIEDIISFTDNSGDSSPIKGSIVSDLGLGIINSELEKPLEELKAKLINNNLINNNSEIKESVTKLLSKLPSSNKDSFIYLNMILERRPAMEANKITECLNKLSQMVDNKNNYVPQIGSRTSFIISCLRDISAPTNISQGNIGTCNPTSMTIELAIRNPLKFLEIADTLAQGKNYDFKDQSGKTIGSMKPNLTFANNGNGVTDKTLRSPSSALMQNSFMDSADGSRRNFNSSGEEEEKGGLFLFQAVALRNMMYADKGETNFSQYSSHNSFKFDETYTINNTSGQINGNIPKNILMSILNENKPSINNPIQVSIVYNSNYLDTNSPHAVLVIDMNDKNVTIINPHGQEEKIPANEFKKRLNEVSSSNDKAKFHIYDKEEIDKLKPEEIINKINSSNILESMKITDIPYLFNKISNIDTKEIKEATKKISELINENIDTINGFELDVLLKQLRLYDFPIDNLLDMVKNDQNKSIDEKIKVLSSLDRSNDILDLINNELKDNVNSTTLVLMKFTNYELNSWIDENMEKISKEKDSSTLVSSLINILFFRKEKLKSDGMGDEIIKEINEELANKINNLVNDISKNPNAEDILLNSLSKLGFDIKNTNSLLSTLNLKHDNPDIENVLKNISNNLSKIIDTKLVNKN